MSGEKPKAHSGQRVGKKVRSQTGSTWSGTLVGQTGEMRTIMSLETREEQGEPEH